MAKRSHRLGSKQFFTMSVLAVSVLGLIVVTGAAMKPTNTQSDASEISVANGCTTVVPTFTAAGIKSEPSYVVYSFNVKNPNPSTCKTPFRYAVYAERPSSKWDVDYRVDGGNWTTLYGTGLLKPGDSDIVKIRVNPSSEVKSKTYTMNSYACQGFLAEGQIFPGDKCTNRTITYTVK